MSEEDEIMLMLKELKKGEMFTKKEIEYPTDMQVFVKGEYDRSTRSYWCHKYGDVNDGCFIKATKKIYTNFIF